MAEAAEVFYGKNQSCRACRETHRTGGNYANYDAVHIYTHPLGEALGRERTSTSASEGVSPTSGSASAVLAAVGPSGRHWSEGGRWIGASYCLCSSKGQ